MRGFLLKRGEVIFVGLIILAVAVANQWQVIYPALHPKPDTVFLGVGHHYEDYFFYLSQFAQGTRGALLATNQFTPEAMPQTTMWLTNVWLGKIGGLIGLTPWWSYSLSVFGLALIYLYLIYKIMTRLFPESGIMRVSGFLLATLTTNFYGINNTGGQLTIQPFEFFYHYTAAFNRLGAVPHLILQNILSLILLLTFSNYLTLKRTTVNRELITVLFTSSWIFIINPVSLFLVWLTCGIVFIYRYAELVSASPFKILKRVQDDIRIRNQIVFFLALTLLPAILLFIQLPSLRHPFFQNFQIWETGVIPASFIEVIKSFGPFLILMVLGLPAFLRKNDSLRLTGSVYAILPLILYFSPIPKWLHLPYFRFLQPAAYVFFGAMTMAGINNIAKQRCNNATMQQFLSVVILTITLGFQLSMLHKEIAGRLTNFIIPSPLNYVPTDLVKGLRELEKYPPGIVLATNTLELLVPTFSGKTVYSAHRSLTIDYYRKITEIARFYHIQMTPEEGREFLQKNNLAYVLWHPEEGDPVLLEKYYPFFKLVYNNNSLRIYQIKSENKLYRSHLYL